MLSGLDSELPLQEHRPTTLLVNLDPASYVGSKRKKRKKERKKGAEQEQRVKNIRLEN